ncbi:MAG: VOC family protein [Pirellulaceae bacterium]
MPPLDILETCLYVNDLAAAERFYSQVLRLTVHSRQEERHVFLRCGRGMLLLFKPDQSVLPGDVPSHGAYGPGHVAFAANEAELPAWRKHLEGHGVSVERVVAWPGGGQSLYFRDPAGNSLELAAPTIWRKE